ncbi:hypothetical protein [Streptomyces sp. DSM 40484]|uniref:hypothetical protein n=1 Tax=Streptomyces kroppenstedtii TaxID=3051181 RepID=UPI0028D8AEA6|nr:hypothetical protein [Streptomyces sp. DSM 40484]
MFELIRTLLEAIVQGIPTYTASKESKRRREIGVGLFRLYVQLNEAMVSASRILSLLDDYAYDRGRRREVTVEFLYRALVSQGNTIESLNREMRRRNRVLALLGNSDFLDLRTMFEHKFSDVRTMGTVLAGGAVPLGEMQSRFRGRGVFPAPGPDQMPYNSSSPVVSFNEARGDFVDVGTVEERAALVRAYLESGVPQQRIQDMRAALEQLRVALTENFSLTDALIDVGDEI